MTKNTSQNKQINGERDAKGRFLTGSNGGPGRKVGSRNKLGEAFISDLHDEWQRSGAEALKRMAKDDPSGFVRVTASLLPRQLDETLNLNLSVIAEAKSFDEAFRFALRHIGSEIETDEPELIEANGDEPGSG